MKRNHRSLLLRIVNAISSLVFVISVVYLFVWGIGVLAVSSTVIAFCFIATPVVIAGEGVLDSILGIVEAFIDGLLAIIEGISNVISGILSA